MSTMLSDARTWAQQISNGTQQDQGFDAVLESVRGLQDQIKGLASYRISGNYIFSGTLTNTPPYDAAGVYQGNDGDVRVPLDGSNVQVNMTAREVFGEVGGGGALDLLDRFEQALVARDRSAVQGLLDEFETAITANSTNLANIGARRAQLEDSAIRIESTLVEVKSRAGDIGDADMAEAISEVQQLQTNYQTTLAAGSRIFGPTFFDYLG